MPTNPIGTPAPARRAITIDFWKFLTGETISNLGSSFTLFALPLLIYQLTGSAVNLALSTAANFLPYLLFGLLIGAWVDRLDRKQMMILTDIGSALVIGSIPLLAALGMMAHQVFFVAWIYGVGFASSILTIFFQSGQFAAIPSLVGKDELVTANGRIQASYSAAQVVGPLLAGMLLIVVPLPMLMVVDALSFLVSACTLALIKTSFNLPEKREKKSIRHDMVEGLRYVLRHPVLRNISMMMALINFVATTTSSQLVLFAEQRLGANNSQVGFLFSAGSIGVVLLSLLAGPLRKRWPFSKVALGALMVEGLLTVLLALTPWYWAAVPLWALISGVGILFNINTGSLRQAIVPNELLGRVISIAGVLAWSAIPAGAFLGGLAIEWTGNVVLVYGAIGVLTFLIPICFAFTALGHAERYLPKDEQTAAQEEASLALEGKVATA
jgi:MFS family permease